MPGDCIVCRIGGIPGPAYPSRPGQVFEVCRKHAKVLFRLTEVPPPEYYMTVMQ